MRIFKHKKNIETPRRRTIREEVRQEQLTGQFLRNRTLTGSSSQHVRSSGENNAQLKSPRAHMHHLANQRRRIVSLLVVVLVVAFFLYIIVSQFTAHVRIAIADFPNQQAQTSYEQAVQSYLSRHPIERLRFFTNINELNRSIQSDNPEVSRIKIEPSSEFATSMITIKVRQPITGWTTNGEQEYVDENGIAFRRNYYEKPALQIVDTSDLPVAAGRAIASDQFLGFVGRLVGSVRKQGYVVTKVAIPTDTTRQIDLSIKGVKYRIKCSVDRSAGEQAEDMARVVTYLAKHRIHPAYIDVRVAGKAYYR